MEFVTIKPLSANEAWKGQRVKSDKYRKYRSDLLYLLPKILLPPPPFEVHYLFAFSNTQSDWDNAIKQFQDVIAEKYNFNDKLILRGIVDKEIVAKGKEYIGFTIKTHKK